MSLVYKNPHYSSALARLDHLGVEQLVIARAQLAVGTKTSIEQAFERLQSLNRRFENTPEIIGLLALVYNALSYASKDNTNDLLQSSLKQANQALALDPTNLDGLTALYYHHITVAGLREQAYSINEAILRHHPGSKNAYRASLNLMIKAMRPCEEIQTFVTEIPTGVFTQHRLAVINTILKVCLQSKPLEILSPTEIKAKTDAITGVSTARINKAINNNLYLFQVRHDMIFDAVKSLTLLTSTQNRLSNYYWLTLLTGVKEKAVSTEKLIDEDGFWGWQLSLYNTLYDIPADFKASEHVLFTAMIGTTNIVHTLAGALIVQSKQTGNPQILTDFLSTMNTFPISLINRHESIALMMLQYHSGQMQLGQVTGKKLFDKLNIYYKENPHSFEFWGLGNYYLIAKFHCGARCQLPSADFEGLADLLFKADHAFWIDDIAFTRVALSPWADDPLVAEYLARIEQDRLRFRTKRGL